MLPRWVLTFLVIFTQLVDQPSFPGGENYRGRTQLNCRTERGGTVIVKYGWGARYHMVLVEQKLGLSCREEDVLSSSWEGRGY